MRYELLQIILLSLSFRLNSSAILPMLFIAADLLDPAKEATFVMTSGNGSSAHATAMRGVHARIDRQLDGGFLLDSVTVQARWALSRCLYSIPDAKPPTSCSPSSPIHATQKRIRGPNQKPPAFLGT